MGRQAGERNETQSQKQQTRQKNKSGKFDLLSIRNNSAVLYVSSTKPRRLAHDGALMQNNTQSPAEHRLRLAGGQINPVFSMYCPFNATLGGFFWAVFSPKISSTDVVPSWNQSAAMSGPPSGVSSRGWTWPTSLCG